jgi:RimJ/RimL family protein N-acetyltransferase
MPADSLMADQTRCGSVAHMLSELIEGVGSVAIVGVGDDHPRPPSPSAWDDWGDMDPAAKDIDLERWIIELTGGGQTQTVGDLSAHTVWYGPTTSSRAVSIGVSLVEEFRGRRIGVVSQRLLAELLHDRGIVRVEASTDVENVAEQRALERAGFAYEGTLRLAQGRRDGLHDLQVWSHVRPPA